MASEQQTDLGREELSSFYEEEPITFNVDTSTRLEAVLEKQEYPSAHAAMVPGPGELFLRQAFASP